MEMILKNGLEWSQMQMKRYKGKGIAGQEIPILTNTRAQEMLDRIPFWPTERQMLDKTWCKMLDTMTFCYENINHTTEIWDMPRLKGYISLLDNMDQLNWILNCDYEVQIFLILCVLLSSCTIFLNLWFKNLFPPE